VRPYRRRTKKLIVAFHFQFSNQAAWKCDPCRKSGLEGKRRCGFASQPVTGQGSPVWIRGSVVVTSCPKSYVTGQSSTLVEEFFTWKLFGTLNPYELQAKTVDAFCVLEKELIHERNHNRE
jgi:hypothetical protein